MLNKNEKKSQCYKVLVDHEERSQWRLIAGCPQMKEIRQSPVHSKIEFFLITLIRIWGFYKTRIYLDFHQEWMECMEHNLITPIGTSYHLISDCVHFEFCWAQCWIKNILTFTLSRPHSLTFISYYNQRQNKLRHFTLNWAFLHFTEFNRRKYSFSFLISSMQCSAYVQATYRKQQRPQLWAARAGEGCKFFFSLKLPLFEYNVVIESLVQWN